MTVMIFRPDPNDPTSAELIAEYECESIDRTNRIVVLAGGIAAIPVEEGDIMIECVAVSERPPLPYFHIDGDVSNFMGIKRQ